MRTYISKAFTLIELVIVISILGILAAIAIPQFVDLRTEAAQAAVDGISGAIAAGCAINYAACKADDGGVVAVANCTAASGLLQGGLPTGYTLTAGALTHNTSGTCTVSNTTNAVSATFSCIGVTVASCPS